MATGSSTASTSKAPGGRRAHTRCAPQSLVSLAPYGASVVCARLPPAPLSPDPTAPAPPPPPPRTRIPTAPHPHPTAPQPHLAPPQPRRPAFINAGRLLVRSSPARSTVCQRNFRSLAVRGPAGRSPAHATASFSHKQLCRRRRFGTHSAARPFIKETASRRHRSPLNVASQCRRRR